MGIQPIDKLYMITDTSNQISCKVKSGRGWYAMYQDHYSGATARDRIIARFVEAIERKGYRRIEKGNVKYP